MSCDITGDIDRVAVIQIPFTVRTSARCIMHSKINACFTSIAFSGDDSHFDAVIRTGFSDRCKLPGSGRCHSIQHFICWLNTERAALPKNDILAAYRLSFVAHFRLVSIHPWADGNGRMARLVMNMLQFEFGLIPTKVLKEQKAEYIQALNDTRDKQDESIFPNVMLRLHNTNLQSEINAFVASQETDVPQGVPQDVLQGVPQDITALIKQNPKITREELAALLHVSVKTIGRRLAKLPHIKYVGSGYSGHWEIIDKEEK